MRKSSRSNPTLGYPKIDMCPQNKALPNNLQVQLKTYLDFQVSKFRLSRKDKSHSRIQIITAPSAGDTVA